MKRVDASARTKQALWYYSGGRCAFRGCRQELLVESAAAEGPAVIGDVAHIVGLQPTASRSDWIAPYDKNDPQNLILLCKNHHKQIDDQPESFPVADYLAEWETLATLDDWTRLVSGLSDSQPRLWRPDHDRLRAIRQWILERRWPEGYFEELRDAFRTMGMVLDDLITVFERHADWRDDDVVTRRFYKITDWDEDRYRGLLNQYEWHVNLVQDLVLELTRAASNVVDVAGAEVAPQYRANRPALTVVRGPVEGLKMENIRPEYKGDERTQEPYPGLTAFETERLYRDFHIALESDDPT